MKGNKTELQQYSRKRNSENKEKNKKDWMKERRNKGRKEWMNEWKTYKGRLEIVTSIT